MEKNGGCDLVGSGKKGCGDGLVPVSGSSSSLENQGALGCFGLKKL
uniref:Uncharacterized protein n=1 Tax=Arundo donax TaxID=35708 RepID=A0A0A8ZPA7_ARUDO